MKILRIIPLLALSGMMLASCSKTDVTPIAATPVAETSTPAANTNTMATQQGRDTVYAYRPDNSGAMGAVIPDSALAGNWTLVSDSTSITHGQSSAFDSGVKYIGKPGDYFNINNDGKMYLQEGSNGQEIDCVETNSLTNAFELMYSQYPNVAVAGSGFIHAQLLPPVVTDHSAILTSQIIGTMGIYTRQFVLKR
jgi:hypothetical protein